jgi:phenylalanyl-tRNA synthetase beta chain
MKISCNWLKDYIPTDLEPVEIARILTDCGLEVEAIEDFETVKGGLRGVVIGQVLSAERHPNADKLTCCKVDIGQDRILDIVCGAPNVAVGQKVPVATVGTIIYKGEDSFTIKEAKLRGEPSEGMICAEDELGLGNSHAGIMILQEDAVIGTHASEYFDVTSDTVLEIAITPNRSDAASHFGVARDLAAALKCRETQHPIIPFTRPELDWDSIIQISQGKHVGMSTAAVKVRIENPEACSRYSGITIFGLKVTDSPAWLQNRLKAIGLRPINNIVDITNYILMETGQPLHAFDLAHVAGNEVIVKKMPAGSKFTTLDGVERELGADDLMICNAVEGMCIGGVFGGLQSGVTTATNAIFLESAYFDPTHIRKTSRLHGLKTDASFRFERGADPEMTIYALKRAALLMAEIAGGVISSDIVDVYPAPFEYKKIELNLARMDSLVGKKIGRELTRQILEALEINILQEGEETMLLAVPPFKVDVDREADVVEEVLRIYGYNNVEIADSVHSCISYSSRPDPERLQNLLCDFLSNNGFHEILTNSLTSSSYYEKSEIFPIEKSVRILNPLSRDLEVLRQTLLFSGLESIAYNLNRKQKNLKFYEVGNTYTLNTNAGHNLDVTHKYNENRQLAIYITGMQDPESWYHSERKSDYAFLKSFVFSLLRKAGIPLWKLQNSIIDKKLFTSGESFDLNGKHLLSLGRLNPTITATFDVRQEVFYAVIDWGSLYREINPDGVRYFEVPKFPEVRRDLALILDQHITFAALEEIAYKTIKGLLKTVNLFDVYEGNNIEKGKKSYALSFTLQDVEKTLTDKEVDQAMSRLAGAFERETGAQIRK